MPIRTVTTAILALALSAIHGAGAQEHAYHFKDKPFTRVAYDKNFFSEVFLNRNIADIEKFRKDRNIITGLFPESNVAAFDLVDLDKLDTVGRTVIIVFNGSNEDKLAVFLSRFKGIQPFAKYFDKQSHCGGATYTQVGQNGEKFLVVKEERNGKDLAYILNFLANVQKIASYKNRADCFKPSG